MKITRKYQALNALADIRDYLKSVSPENYNLFVDDFNLIAGMLRHEKTTDWAVKIAEKEGA